MNRNEKYELDFQRFINSYKWKTKDEIISSTVEIKSSNISRFEDILLDGLRTGDFYNHSIGRLTEIKSVLSRLYSESESAKEHLNERLQIVSGALKKK